MEISLASLLVELTEIDKTLPITLRAKAASTEKRHISELKLIQTVSVNICNTGS